MKRKLFPIIVKKDKDVYTTFYPNIKPIHFSRFTLIPTKYRIGLSSNPYRKDNRKSYIFALTGFPIGLDCPKYMKTVDK